MDADLGDYRLAQRAIADLKAAVLSYVQRHSALGVRNADVGKALGIYFGHEGHVGHVSRAVLALLAQEGLIRQNSETKQWTAIFPSSLEQTG